MAVAAPGKSSDQAAIECTGLPATLDTIPLDSFVVGDAAYTLSHNCITPFTGLQQLNPTKDAYNYFLSQVQIRIEMAFGLLTTKWQILKNPLGVSLHVGSELLECISRLHNYCIDMRPNDLCSEIDEIIPVPTSPLGWGISQLWNLCKFLQYLEYQGFVMHFLVWCHRIAFKNQHTT